MSALIIAAVPVIAVSRPVLADSAGVRTLRFTHTHTGERLAIEYFRGGTYMPDLQICELEGTR